MKPYPDVPTIAPAYPVYPSFQYVTDPNELETQFLERLRTLLLEKAFDSRYTVPRLCRDIGMSSSQLHRKLAVLVGHSAISIIIAVRLERAKNLLLSDLCIPVNQIAFDCGFDDPDYFSRVFSKRFGVSPTKFRNGA